MKKSTWKILSIFSILLFIISTFTSQSIVKGDNSGNTWTTKNSCGLGQVNFYNVGDVVYINGTNFNPGSYPWNIVGQPGGASGDPNITVASGNVTIDQSGDFCFQAYTIAMDDWGTYSADVGNKNSNYHVNEPPVIPTKPTAEPIDPIDTPTNISNGTPLFQCGIGDSPWLIFPSKTGKSYFAHSFKSGKLFKINMPPALDPTDLISGISPNGRILLVRSGTQGSYEELAIYKIVNPCLSAEKITDLLSLKLQREFQNPNENLTNTLSALQQSNPISWSSDSRMAIFPAALYGNSSDIVLFTLAGETIDSLGFNYRQDMMPSWGPYSEWAVYQSIDIYPRSTPEMRTQLFAMDLSDPVTVPNHYAFPSSSFEGSFAGWLTGKIFLTYSESEYELMNLRLNEVDSGKSQIIFSGTFNEIVVDSQNGGAALIVRNEQNSHNTNVSGVYYLPVYGDKISFLMSGIFTNLEYSSEVEKFMASNGKEVVIFDKTGVIQTVPNEQRLNFSPNGNYFIGWGSTGARLYSSDGKLIRTITNNSVTASIWEPSTKGFYLLQSNGLYQYVLPSLQGKLVTQDVYENNEDTFVWLRGY